MRLNMKRRMLVVFALSLIALSSLALSHSYGAPTDGAIWPMFGGGVLHNGRSIYSAEENPGKVLWAYKTGGMVRTSPAIDFDGSIYIGSDDGYLYALSREGSLRWRFKTGGPIRSSPAITGNNIVFGSYVSGQGMPYGHLQP